MAEPYELTLHAAARAIRERTLSPVELTRSLLARIEAREPAVLAWARLTAADALAEASRCEDEAMRGAFRGPLHGVPVGIKDLFYTAGVETAAGSAVLAGFTPAFDATAVRRLRDAGAVVLGKTALSVFAAMDPGPTRNPWNPAHTPGGSSSGSAAAVAALMCPAALGTQTAGSIVRPAITRMPVTVLAAKPRRRASMPASPTGTFTNVKRPSTPLTVPIIGRLSEAAIRRMSIDNRKHRSE